MIQAFAPTSEAVITFSGLFPSSHLCRLYAKIEFEFQTILCTLYYTEVYTFILGPTYTILGEKLLTVNADRIPFSILS